MTPQFNPKGILVNVVLATAILAGVGSLVGAFDFCNPLWMELGVSGNDLRGAIVGFPTNNCPTVVQPVCEAMSKTTLWFIGLEHSCSAR